MRRPALLALVLAAATVVAPRGADASCTSPVPASDQRVAVVQCKGAGVGMLLLIPSLKWGPDYPCAASYAFADQAGSRYLTFPGSCYLDYHCLEDAAYDLLPPPLDQVVPRVPVCLMPGESENEPAFRGNKGPIVTDENHRKVGRIVYAVNKDEVDFALLRVDPGVALDPRVPFYGGPTKIGTAGSLEEARVYSPPQYAGTSPNAHLGLLQGDSELAFFAGGDFDWPGGTVLRPNGEAIGFLMLGSWIPQGRETQPLQEAVDRASRRTGLVLRLMTAPLAK